MGIPAYRITRLDFILLPIMTVHWKMLFFAIFVNANKKNLSLITKVVVIWIHELFLANANIFSYKCILRLLIEGKRKSKFLPILCTN